MNTWLSSTRSIKIDKSQKNLKDRSKFELASSHDFLPSNWDAQRPDSEHIIETDSGDHIGIVIQLCIETLFCKV